ncbi:PQQ-binding-like beta-propeller repeat protein [Natrinema halophilum]|uniref:PQQ-binding-like beta-propeller repeat protein n=1 Tax=Natrinema halophilum TaxID=1699371 RepID=A0A7D5KDH3_9EURY|nr:PQQ-binding-like beta-propeller repeat protein [Natrinema halophilum]QLG49401.1 PQQ-like beta-propeller repeat protein [Natrinema halophilum]
MPDWHRRSLLATCATLSTTGVLASEGSSTDPDDASDVAQSGVASPPDGWSSAWGNAGNTGYLPLEDEFPEPNSIAWRYELPSFRTWHDGKVAVVDGRIFLLTNYAETDERVGGFYQTYENQLHALDAETGELEWQAEVKAKKRPTVVDGTVYVEGRDRVVAFDAADGSVSWERELDTIEWVTNPTPADGALYVVAGETLYALDGDDGSVRWRRERVTVRPENEAMGDPVPTSFAAETVAIVDGTVYAITRPCNENSSNEVEEKEGVAALSAKTGEPEWAVVPEGGVSTLLMAADEFVFGRKVADMNDETILDRHTGEVVGRETVDTVAATSDVRVTYDGGAPGGGDISVHPYDDGEHWTVSGVHSQAPLIVGETLIAFQNGSVTGFDLESGTVMWRWERDLDPRALVAVDENTLYVGINTELVALRPSDGEADDQQDDPDDDGQQDDPDDDDQQDDPDDDDQRDRPDDENEDQCDEPDETDVDQCNEPDDENDNQQDESEKRQPDDDDGSRDPTDDDDDGSGDATDSDCPREATDSVRGDQ